jgi:hypothetical protein
MLCSCVWGTTAGLRQPLLVHDARSPGNRVFQSGVAHPPRAGGRQPKQERARQPPWFNQRRCKRESFPWSAHADCSWRTTLRPGRRIALSAMHKRMFTRAGGVSPPWLTTASARAIAHTHVTTVSPTKSGGRQPAVAQNRIGNRNRPHPRGVRLLHKSGGRKPPVGSGTALTASGKDCRMAAGERQPPVGW